MSAKSFHLLWKAALVFAALCGAVFLLLWTQVIEITTFNTEQQNIIMAASFIFTVSGVMLAMGAYLFAHIKEGEER
jgi:hypothetical protein